MTRTTVDTLPSPIPAPPCTTYRIEFEAPALELYQGIQLYWLPQIKEFGRDQFRFVSRTDYRSDFAIVMITPFQWNPIHTRGAVGGDGVTIIKAPVTFLSRDVGILRSRFGEDLWTLGNAKKNIAWIAELPVQPEEVGLEMFIEVVDVSSASQLPHTEGGAEQTGYIGSTFNTLLPQWIKEHGSPLSVDMDDARGRLVCSLRDGALGVIEFV
jgi:hypothetical protein